MNRWIFIIILCLFQCKKNEAFNEISVTKGHTISIQFDIQNIQKIKEGDFFTLDQNKFIHKNNGNRYDENTLPTPKPILNKIEDKSLYGEINIIDFGYLLSQKIKKMKIYELMNTKQTYINGVVTLRRKDGKTIKITKSISYPLKVNVI